MKKLIIMSYCLCFMGLSFLASCSDVGQDSVPGGNSSAEWLIPSSEVFDGGPGKDGIPSIDKPKFSDVSGIDFLSDNDLVIGIKVGNEVRAYSHSILDWHEIVNDKIGNLPIAINYCPLTGTGIGWKREIKGQETTFGVSGLLYNTNLILYDRKTDSRWSQMLLTSVNGEMIGAEADTYPVVETTWKTWKTLFPNSKVLNKNTGFSRNYGVYPYGSYRTNHDLLIFPVSRDDNRLPRKERGLGIILGGRAKFYSLQSFGVGTVQVVQDQFFERELVLAGSAGQNFLVVFERRLPDGTLLDFQASSQVGQPIVMTDSEGNQWNIFGEAVAGPRQGTQLKPLESYIGYWFAWATFYPDIQIF